MKLVRRVAESSDPHQQLMCARVLEDLPVRQVADEYIVLPVDGDPDRLPQFVRAKDVEKLAGRRVFLYALVELVGDIQVVVGVDRQIGGSVELIRSGSIGTGRAVGGEDGATGGELDHAVAVIANVDIALVIDDHAERIAECGLLGKEPHGSFHGEYLQTGGVASGDVDLSLCIEGESAREDELAKDGLRSPNQSPAPNDREDAPVGRSLLDPAGAG